MSEAKVITAYRPCVGIMLLNPQGLVWVGRRFQKQNDDGVGHWWQMPQGGIDCDEDPAAAALRELEEETAVRSAEIIAEAPDWYNYDLPEHLIGKSWKGKYRGQTQKWFAARFTGEDSEINLAPPGHKQEFDQWRWIKMNEVIDAIIPFKKPVYEQVIAAFRHLGQS
ncbi:MAG: RNA pyrophosphohydrolase [Aestuariivirga sp.]|nr:RNA pyrophosphohydrolase [Aestuariivirga sp.]